MESIIILEVELKGEKESEETRQLRKVQLQKLYQRLDIRGCQLPITRISSFINIPDVVCVEHNSNN